MTVEFAPAVIVRAEKDQVVRVVEAIKEVMGFDGVVVSDESKLSDFSPDESEVAEIADKLGLEIKRSDYIYEIALRLKPSN